MVIKINQGYKTSSIEKSYVYSIFIQSLFNLYSLINSAVLWTNKKMEVWSASSFILQWRPFDKSLI